MDLKEVLRLHLMWLGSEDGGKRADLEDANLEDADLKWANLRGANLSGADLSWANLRGANLEGAILEGANMSGANLEGAILEGVNMRGVNMRWADLTGANLDYAAWPLWCGSFDAKADRRLAAQLAYHFCRIDFGNDEVCLAAQDALVTLANEFHRVGERGIPSIEEQGGGS